MKNNNIQQLMEFIERMDDCSDIDNLKNEVLNVNNENIDYNYAVTIFVMHLNKLISIYMNNIQETDDAKYSGIIKNTFNNINDYCNKLIEEIRKKIELNSTEDLNIYINYLTKVKDNILKSINYYEPKEEYYESELRENEWNTRYRREERIRD